MSLIVGLAAGLLAIAGCRIDALNSALAAQSGRAASVLVKDKIRVHALSHNPAENLLIDELVELKTEIESKTGLDLSAASPIDVYLFKDETSFHEFTAQANAVFADRRAFFIKTEDALNVYGFWGMRVAEDLRHETTHGYLHGTFPEIDLWIDEGLAEYFEVPPDARGVNTPHVRLLIDLHQKGLWQPSLERLESITDPRQLTQIDYAEAWLWVHLLMSSPVGKEVLTTGLKPVEHLARVPWAVEVSNMLGDAHSQLLDHLEKLHRGIGTYRPKLSVTSHFNR